MIKNRNNNELPNEKNFSNVVDWGKVSDLAETVKDTIAAGKNNGKGINSQPVSTPKSDPISETTIFGMHPVTLMIATVVFLGLSITSVVLYNKFNK